MNPVFKYAKRAVKTRLGHDHVRYTSSAAALRYGDVCGALEDAVSSDRRHVRRFFSTVEEIDEGDQKRHAFSIAHARIELGRQASDMMVWSPRCAARLRATMT